jgi:hypothetical protein
LQDGGTCVEKTVGANPVMVQDRSEYEADAAAAAAGLLLRVGIGILCVIVPLLMFLSRRVVVLMVPVGLTTIIIASTIISEDFEGMRRLRAILMRPVGTAAALLALWTLLSLSWTPFPAEASERLFKGLGTLLLAFSACLALPVRMRAPNLNLITLGILTSIVLSIAISVAALLGKGFVASQPVTLARASITLALLGWVAVAWLQTRGQRGLAVSMILLLAVSVYFSGSLLARITFCVSGAVFLIVSSAPRAALLCLGAASALAVLVAPLSALLSLGGIFDAAAAHPMLADSLIALRAWADLILAYPLRLLTGHGFETVARARAAGIIPEEVPRYLIFDIWYELGIVGAVATAALLYTTFRLFVRLSRNLSAPLAAAVSGAFVVAILGNGMAQSWWLSSLAMLALNFMAVRNGQHRMQRPKARDALPVLPHLDAA